MVKMSLNTNRLNLPNMVDNSLRDRHSTTEVFFNPYTIFSRHEKQFPPRDQTKKKPKTSIATSLNSIYATVHSKLRPHKSRHAVKVDASPSIPIPIAQTMKDQTSEKETKTGKNKSLVHATLSLEKKSQERRRRSNDTSNYTMQQRAREIVRQKRMLEDMLEEHQKLQRDRQSVTLEIRSMKSYLNEIRQKLDLSLRKLNAQNTVFGQLNKNAKSMPVGTGYTLGHEPTTPGGRSSSRTGSKQRTLSLDSRVSKRRGKK